MHRRFTYRVTEAVGRIDYSHDVAPHIDKPQHADRRAGQRCDGHSALGSHHTGKRDGATPRSHGEYDQPIRDKVSHNPVPALSSLPSHQYDAYQIDYRPATVAAMPAPTSDAPRLY
ncbi:hypothetical protein GCM10011289_27390 [Paludibacterium paludis]|uniref:Uncharacterized protein n=1 Tax=Paludibacterium paludis TaxID=1225769 RepID=A0A918UB51_9NEIS|nr:hypothetical protein GCM10011289_27390 [Paludibacterium paludis]